MSNYLLSICGSRLTAKLLAVFAASPKENFRTRQIAAQIEEDPGNVQKHLARLAKKGFLVRHFVSHNSVYYRASSDCEVWPEIRRLASQHRVSDIRTSKDI